MNFNTDKVSFGRHESFALRYSWLTKGFQAFELNPDIFNSPDSIATLGVGKNMVNSIRFWLRAAKLIEITAKKKESTVLGKFILSKNGCDPYLEDEATIWLIHWLIATNAELATTWYWFFNRFHKPEFTSTEVATSLLDFVKENVPTRTSTTSIKHDVSVLLRMYTQTRRHKKISMEESLDSPLSLLNLVKYSPTTKIYQSKLLTRNNLPLGILGYVITEFFQKNNRTEIPIENLMYSKDGNVVPGLVFRLSEIGLLTKLEQLTNYIPGVYEIRETAGIHQMYMLSPISALDYLKKHYKTYNDRAKLHEAI